MNDALIEAVAKAVSVALLCERPWDQLSETAKSGAINVARSALAAIEESGSFVVAPVHPTKEMAYAAPDFTADFSVSCEHVYEAMLAARPKVKP